MFLNKVPMDRDTLSPEPLVYFFMRVYRSPQKGALLQNGKNLKSPSTEAHADGRPTYSGVRPGFPRHCYLFTSAMQPSARYLSRWLG